MLSVVEVSPFASIPANRIADFICALGINELCEIPFKSLLKIDMGSFPSLLFDFKLAKRREESKFTKKN